MGQGSGQNAPGKDERRKREEEGTVAVANPGPLPQEVELGGGGRLRKYHRGMTMRGALPACSASCPPGSGDDGVGAQLPGQSFRIREDEGEEGWNARKHGALCRGQEQSATCPAQVRAQLRGPAGQDDVIDLNESKRTANAWHVANSPTPWHLVACPPRRAPGP